MSETIRTITEKAKEYRDGVIETALSIGGAVVAAAVFGAPAAVSDAREPGANLIVTSNSPLFEAVHAVGKIEERILTDTGLVNEKTFTPRTPTDDEFACYVDTTCKDDRSLSVSTPDALRQ